MLYATKCTTDDYQAFFSQRQKPNTHPVITSDLISLAVILYLTCNIDGNVLDKIEYSYKIDTHIPVLVVSNTIITCVATNYIQLVPSNKVCQLASIT